MNHSSENESLCTVPAIEYRNVYKRFDRTDGKSLHVRHVRKGGDKIKKQGEDSFADAEASAGALNEETGFYAVNNLSAEIRDGELITILGSSGCGKTTLLKMTNRLYEPDGGSILLFGEDIQKQDPVQLRRKMGYVIQQAGLFPHMTVEDNISVIPRLLKWEPARCRDRVTELLELVGLEPELYRNRYPSQLSGVLQTEQQFDRVLELIGPATLRDTFSHVAEGGIVCSTGQLGGQWTLNDFDPIFELPANGYLTSFYSGNVDPARLQSLLDYVRTYGIDPAPARVFSLPQVAEAHAWLESARSFGKVIVVI